MQSQPYFPELLSWNLILYHWLSVPENSKITHRMILSKIPHYHLWRSVTLHYISLEDNRQASIAKSSFMIWCDHGLLSLLPPGQKAPKDKLVSLCGFWPGDQKRHAEQPLDMIEMIWMRNQLLRIFSTQDRYTPRRTRWQSSYEAELEAEEERMIHAAPT